MLRLVADLGIADRIASDGHAAVDALAAECGVQPQPLIRVLRALAAFDVFSVAADGSIAHTPRSQLLRTDTPNSMHYSARFWTAPGSWAAWGMLDVAMTGGVPHLAAWNTSRFDYLRAHPDEARGFDAMMANFPDNRHAAVAAAYDFSRARLIGDIGGGNGAMLRHILSRFATPRGLLFDRDHVVDSIQAGELLDGRIEVARGSFFDRIPHGADVYIMSRVLHDWPDEDCAHILRVCRAAMGPDARLLICELILEPDPARGRPADYLVDTQMMAMFGSARERTADEFASLLNESGLALRRIIPTESPVWILEAAPS
jgi:SAM-dependent methyltransferase